ncbi:hypothetical protein L2E82_06340 [Cichorium intybus]|uniref:Uncharacterized protein n=1 Tax=Cichorium intybus TaxID=13427 RepID=A0ACB9HAZ5_CICIN|nr:hypothetical protein L2E82_06340 [Cichorium intybus]
MAALSNDISMLLSHTSRQPYTIRETCSVVAITDGYLFCHLNFSSNPSFLLRGVALNFSINVFTNLVYWVVVKRFVSLNPFTFALVFLILLCKKILSLSIFLQDIDSFSLYSQMNIVGVSVISSRLLLR